MELKLSLMITFCPPWKRKKERTPWNVVSCFQVSRGKVGSFPCICFFSTAFSSKWSYAKCHILGWHVLCPSRTMALCRPTNCLYLAVKSSLKLGWGCHRATGRMNTKHVCLMLTHPKINQHWNSPGFSEYLPPPAWSSGFILWTHFV